MREIRQPIDPSLLTPRTFLQKMHKEIERVIPTLRELGILAISFPFLTRTKPSRNPKLQRATTVTDQGAMQQAQVETINRIGQLRRKSPRWLTPTQARNEIQKRYGIKMLRALENHTYSGTPPAEVTALLRIANSLDPDVRFRVNFNEVLAEVYEDELNPSVIGKD